MKTSILNASPAMAALFAETASATRGGRNEMLAYLGQENLELMQGEDAARIDEHRDFTKIARDADPCDVDARIAGNLIFSAAHRRQVTPDAPALSEMHNGGYRDAYRRLRQERMAKGGVLPSDPGQRRSTSLARGGDLTATELAQREAALTAARASR
jgi:hypothetical protein